MFLYITLGTNDLPRAKRFYDAALPCLGLQRGYEDASEIGYGPPGERLQLWVTTPYDGKPATSGNGSMPAFEAASRAAVDAFHAAGLQLVAPTKAPPACAPWPALLRLLPARPRRQQTLGRLRNAGIAFHLGKNIPAGGMPCPPKKPPAGIFRQRG